MNYALIRRVLEARIQHENIDFAESADEERNADTLAQQAVEAAADARFGGSRRSRDAEVVASVLTAVGSALALAGNVGECKVASATGAASGLVNVVAGPDGASAEAAVAEDIAKADASVARAVRKAREADRDQTIDRLREILLRRHA